MQIWRRRGTNKAASPLLLSCSSWLSWRCWLSPFPQRPARLMAIPPPSKPKAQATAILEYAEQVKMAVDKVYNRGCLDTQISFENPIVSGYTNPNSPSDKSCHVFNPNGGGITYQKPLSNWLDSTYSGAVGFGYWSVSGKVCVNLLGNCKGGPATPHLVMGVPYIRQDVCLEINKRLGNPVPANDAAYADIGCAVLPYHYFNGSYVTNTDITGASADGKMVGCYKGGTCGVPAGGGGYYFYQVLIVR